jgi:uncharacterized protein
MRPCPQEKGRQGDRLKTAIDGLEAPLHELRQAVEACGLESGLRSLGLVLTTDCNLQCAYCYQPRDQRRSMPWEIACRAIELLFHAGDPNPLVTFFGGEPLLEKSLLRRAVDQAIAQAPSGVRPRFRVTTNGTLLDPSLMKFLADHRVHTVISFDGSPAAQERRSPGTSGAIGGALEWAAASVPEFFRRQIEVRITLTSVNLPFLAASVEGLIGRGVRTISIAPVFTHDSGWTPDSEGELDRQTERIQEMCAASTSSGHPVPVTCLRRPTVDRSGVRREQWMCGAVNGERAVVNVDGVAFGCSAFVDSLMRPANGPLAEAANAMRIGDITDPDFMDLFEVQTHELQAVRAFGFKGRKASSFRRCADCEAFEECIVCPASIGYAQGAAESDCIPDIQCAFNYVTHRWRNKPSQHTGDERSCSANKDTPRYSADTERMKI